MKRLGFLCFFAFLSCAVPQKQAQREKIAAIKAEKNEDGEWDLDVMDGDWNYFLNAIAKPMNLYSESYLKSKNTFLVTEWNGLFYSGRYRDIVEMPIDYNPQENYGLKFEYKLYQVFVYARWKYGLHLNNLAGADLFR